MSSQPSPDNEQAALWNGVAGHAWVQEQALLDSLMAPFEKVLADTIPAGAALQVLDVGCGTGATTLAAARRLGPAGRAVGIDISQPMLAHARTRAEQAGLPVQFICADAQAHAFEPASLDRFISRFGVMFFGDPVAAFANLRRAAKQGAELRCIVWRSAAENPFMTTAERAAAPLLPSLPARRPEGPGQFAFADPATVRRILGESGWAGIDLQPIDVVCKLPEQALMPYLSRLGPLGRVLPEVPEPLRSRVMETVRAAFESYVHGDEVRYTAACWILGGCAGPHPSNSG